MSLIKKIKERGFSIPLLKISFSTGGAKVKVHSVRVPILGIVGEKKEEKKDEQKN